jgi:phosphoserine phosphatase
VTDAATRPPGDERPTLLVTATGRDRPGVTSALFSVVEEHHAEVVDLEQIVVRGHLTLSFLLAGWSDETTLRSALHRAGRQVGMTVSSELGTGDHGRRRGQRSAVVVIGSPLRGAQVSALTRSVSELGGNIDRIRRLARYPVTAIELDVSGPTVAELRGVLGPIASAAGFDVSVAPGGLARRGRRLVVMDVDSTLIQDEVIELLAEHAGRGAEVAAVTERAMRGELDFAQSLHERVATLAGLPESVLAEVRAAVRLTPGARTLVRTLKRLGFTVALVSGGFLEIVQPIADELEIDHARANELEVVDGRLTGRVRGAIVDRAGKASALREFAALEGLPLSRTVAIGDGANDLDMLQVAGLGVAFNAKPVVQAQAHTAVNVPYLDAVLFLLGITRDEVEDADASDG